MGNEPLMILVDEHDREIGQMPKMEAHEKGVLHRAFSVFLINDSGELLLQQRALNKYHSPGLWTNTCCSHPFPGERVEDAANRRLMEEMGMKAELTKMFSFMYKHVFDNGLTEHEFDHVFIGKSGMDPEVNPNEVEDFKWMNLEEVQDWMDTDPAAFTPWFKIVFQRFVTEMKRLKS